MRTAKQEWQSGSAVHESIRAGNGNDSSTGDVSVWVDRRRAEIGDYLDRMQARQRRALNLAVVAGGMRVCVDRDCGYRRPAAHKLADRQPRPIVSGMANPVRGRDALLARCGDRDSATEIPQR
jgi:hypothetical protein